MEPHKPLQRRYYAAVSIMLLLCAAVMGGNPDYSPAQLQPSTPGLGATFATLAQAPAAVLRFMAADMLFIIGYTTLFIAVYGEVRPRQPVIAGTALAAAILMALCDLSENAFITSLTLQGLDHPYPSPFWLYMVAAMKWQLSFLCLFLFALLWPWRDTLTRAIGLCLWSVPLVGVLSIAQPQWQSLRPMPLMALFLLLGVYYWRRTTPQVS